LISKACNLTLDPAVIQTGIRFICDTQRTLALGRKLAQTLDPLTADIVQITSHARNIAGSVLMDLPHELEIELVSGWPWPGGYRPSPDKPRGPIDAKLIVERVAELASQCDDLLVFLGGFGEPSAHPELGKIVTGLKNTGVWSIGMHSTALFDSSMSETITSLPIDILALLIDVPQRELYKEIMGIDHYEQVQKNIERVMKTIETHLLPTPLLAPTMIKTPETMELMDAFFDGWFNKVGWAVINGYSDYAGQIPNHAVNSMAGPKRKSCRQIYRRMTIFADGNVVPCDQDFNAQIPLASIREQSLIDIWQGLSLHELRESHLTENFCPNILCSRCRQWHRP
jgi:radical SAM protein with 4Fe4S-binding SPASM domain